MEVNNGLRCRLKVNQGKHRHNGLGYWLKVNQGKHTDIMKDTEIMDRILA